MICKCEHCEGSGKIKFVPWMGWKQCPYCHGTGSSESRIIACVNACDGVQGNILIQGIFKQVLEQYPEQNQKMSEKLVIALDLLHELQKSLHDRQENDLHYMITTKMEEIEAIK